MNELLLPIRFCSLVFWPKQVAAAIIPIAGSVEIAPEMNLADAVCDVVQTGKTLEAHNLVPLTTILESQAVLITNSLQKVGKQHEKLIKLLSKNN